MILMIKPDYHSLVTSLGVLLERAREKAYQQVNQILVETYWELGKRIVEFEQQGKERAKYGGKLLNRLSVDLTSLYGRGFSQDNLEKMRRFYLTFPNSATLSRKFSWSHYCLLFRIDNELARDFYRLEAERECWSVRELDRQINSLLFERIALSKDKKGVLELARKGQIVLKASDLVKDPYIFEFLGLEEFPRYSETILEERMITHLKQFLLELGKGFTFVARQQRMSIEDEHYYIDLVFYNRILRCFVLMELKIGKLTHQDLGQLQMYVNYYDREVKQPEENQTIGILLCADKKDAIVRYTLPENVKNIFASKYKIYLPNKKELEERLQKLLKTEED